MNRVIVVESGAKTRTIRGFLGGEYDVVACGGHIVDLPDDELGIDVEGDFSYEVEPIPRRGGDAVESIRSKLEDADEVYLATDPDREGEAIAADLREFAVPTNSDVYRIEFNAIVYPVVKEALENPREIDEDRVMAQRARRSLDRLIGFILSSMAKFDPEGPHVPSVGRVQSPAVRLVVDREEEIESFEPHQYWTIHADIGDDDEAFEATLSGEWDGFDDAKTAIADLTATGAFTVEACDVDPADEQNPLPPYTTDALQNDADYLLNFSPERTMELAQQLYEGIEIGDGEDTETKALITYMRTDSTRVSPSALNLAKEALATRPGLGEDLYRGRTWEAGGDAQDAHEAIRPTQPEDPAVWPENLEDALDEPLLDLYTLIYNRFLASQMVPAVYRTTTLELTAGSYEATAVGHERRSPGFLTVWEEVRPEHGWDEVSLPEPDPGAELPITRAWPEPQETRPSPRYREGSLVSELKNRGIGRPSTYGEILAKIKQRRGGYGYVRKSRGTLRPTEKGRVLVEYLSDRFGNVVDYEYTARMESDLDRIEAGSLSYQEFLSREFEWLTDPYTIAKERDWLAADRPTPVQIEFLNDLSAQTNIDVPDEVYESKEQVSAWIDKLQDEVEPFVQLTDIHDADVDGVSVHRFQLYFNEPLPEEEYEFLTDLGLKYKRGGKDRLPGFQFQRQDRDVTERTWNRLRERYATGNALEEFAFETSRASS